MDTIDNKLILVPCDFTPISYYALEHGAIMAKSMKQRLMLLHVVQKESDIPAAEKKLSFVVEECFDKFAVRPEFIIRTGVRPYSVIKCVARELNPTFVILKTGGINGENRPRGSRTIKILSGSMTPFLVIQDPPQDTTLKNIVFPINFLRKHDAKLRRVVFFSQFYPEATMHIITPSGKNTVKEKNVTGNLTVMEKALRNQCIKVNFIIHDKKNNTAVDIIEKSKEINADMIMIQMEDVTALGKFLFGLREERLITNTEKIPVMCINRLSDFKGLE